jgi:hypothetical protein
VADRIADAAQLAFLCECGCDEILGPPAMAPLPPDACARLLP